MARNEDVIREEGMMYGKGAMTEQELDEKYPNRPHNHAKTIPFHDLYLTLFNPLDEARKRPTRPVAARSKVGPDGPHRPNKNEARRQIIERFISRWRKEVGNDIYPAIRLIIPDKDRERAMYGLKELTLGKLLVKVMAINKESEDGYNLLHWKLPGLKSSTAAAGDFAGRCFEVIKKRAMRTEPGDLSIAEINQMLDQLSTAQKEDEQTPILKTFYDRMNAEEMLWLIRIILRQIKIGATERTILEVWHQDAENLFNISSSLRRVCWELYDPATRLVGDERGINLMQCFVPQLAAFQMRSMEQMVAKMKLVDENDVFWIEEKLDGERMQLHMVDDESVPGGKRFRFWSRKAKDYTYLYGEGLETKDSALTQHLGTAFYKGVRNIILDGEMITWNMEQDCIEPFGTLKTAALAEQANPYSGGKRPLFKVFDCLYLNDKDLTNYELQARRKALVTAVNSVSRRLEIHAYKEAKRAADIEPMLRDVVARSTEGLVLKNPRSAYKLNERNDDWIKVKPEYMTEFGESLDCVILGGYYGTGHRGNTISSFMCGLRARKVELEKPGVNEQKCYSFFKVGGGFTASDYRELDHRLKEKWQTWDKANPPSHIICLGGGDKGQFERPDKWVEPKDSIVIEVKAASVSQTDQFGTTYTLRFPRFKRFRFDKDWQSALSIDTFLDLKSKAEKERNEKQFKVDDDRKRRRAPKRKRTVAIVGADANVGPYAGPHTKVFQDQAFLILADATQTIKKKKPEIEQLVKSNGGVAVASDKDPKTIPICDRRVVKAASLMKRGDRSILQPKWLYDCVKQAESNIDERPSLLPPEPAHYFFATPKDEQKATHNIDDYGDPWARDIDVEEVKALLQGIDLKDAGSHKPDMDILAEDGLEIESLPAMFFSGAHAVDYSGDEHLLQRFRFAGGTVGQPDHVPLTHVIVSKHGDLSKVKRWPSAMSEPPRTVTSDWIQACWDAKTRLDEDSHVAR